MARPRAFDEKRVLDLAMDVFCSRGYEGATMTELSAVMGMAPPSIYAAFGSKRGLFDAVLERYTDCEAEHVNWVLSAPTAHEVVERLLFRAADQLPNGYGPPGCLLIQAGLTTGPENVDIPKDLARRRQAAELALRDRFENAKAAGDLPSGTDAAGLAGFVTAVFGGLSVKAAEGASRTELRKIADQAMLHWESRTDHVPRSKHPAPGNVGAAVGGRGRPREFSAGDALGAAMEVFWRKGYEGASLTDLTEAMRITRPSLYATFGNKEALFLKALDRYQQENMAYVAKALTAPTARAVVEEILEGAVSAQLSDCKPRGCLAVINAMQGGDEAKGIRAEIFARAATGRTVLIARFARAREEGDLPATIDPEGLTRLLESVIQGIAIQGAGGASEEALRALAKSVLALWPIQ